MTTATTLPPCPRCGSVEAIRIVYGYPGPEMAEAEERGEIRLGGCCDRTRVARLRVPRLRRSAAMGRRMTMTPMTDTIRAAVYGHLVGDALGVPYEFGHHIDTRGAARPRHAQPATGHLE